MCIETNPIHNDVNYSIRIGYHGINKSGMPKRIPFRNPLLAIPSLELLTLAIPDINIDWYDGSVG